MPSFIWSDTLTANQRGQAPILAWQFARVPTAFGSGAFVAVLQRATTVGVQTSIFTGSQNIVQESPCPGGGTIGNTPVLFNTPVIDFNASPDDLLQILNNEILAGTPTVDGIITIEPN